MLREWKGRLWQAQGAVDQGRERAVLDTWKATWRVFGSWCGGSGRRLLGQRWLSVRMPGGIADCQSLSAPCSTPSAIS